MLSLRCSEKIQPKHPVFKTIPVSILDKIWRKAVSEKGSQKTLLAQTLNHSHNSKSTLNHLITHNCWGQVSPWRLAKFIAASREANPLAKVNINQWLGKLALQFTYQANLLFPWIGRTLFFSKSSHDCFQSVCLLWRGQTLNVCSLHSDNWE